MKNLIIENKTTIIDALQKLERNNHKCLLIVNKLQKFVGTLNDGDIRRAILKGARADSLIDRYVKKNPVFLLENQKNNSRFFDKNNRLSNILLKKINDNKIDLIPVLDKNQKVKEIIFEKDIKNFIKKKNNNSILNKVPVIIMAGGKGTRLKQFSYYFPKPLIPFQDITAIEYIINTFKNYGFKKIIVSINYKKNLIKSYLNESNIKNITFINEKKPMGSAGSISLLKGKLNNNFFIINCDTLLNINLNKFYDFHINNNCFLSLVAAQKKIELLYGTCEIKKNGELNKIIEKPKLEYLANVGLYLFNVKIFKYIKKNAPLEMDDLIRLVKRKRKKIGVFPISENNWIDTGFPTKEEKSF